MTLPKTAAQWQADQATRAAQKVETAATATEWLVLMCACCKPSHWQGVQEQREQRELHTVCRECGEPLTLCWVGDALQKVFSRWAGRAARMDAAGQGQG